MYHIEENCYKEQQNAPLMAQSFATIGEFIKWLRGMGGGMGK